MMRSQTVAARDASMPLRITDRVRILPHSNREVLLGTAGVTILVAMKNQWGSVATLLDHDHVAGNFDVREHEIEYVQAMGPTATFCASFRKVDVVYMPDEPHGASCKMGSVYVAVGRKYILNKTLYGGKFGYYLGGGDHSDTG